MTSMYEKSKPIQDVLTIPLNALVDGKLEIKGIYDHCTTIFKMFLDFYETRVSFKRLKPLEELTTAEKNQLWLFSADISQDKEERIKICKVSYFIDHLVTELFS